MRQIHPRARRLLAGEDGPTAVEYAVMLAFILIAGFLAVTFFGTSLAGLFGAVSSAVSGTIRPST